MRLLCLSNGHGEDTIALRILQELQHQPKSPALAALALVGEGRAYTQADIPLVGSVKAMPSGGFIYMDGRQLARDLRGGLVQLTLAQLKAMRGWVKAGAQSGTRGQAADSFILAVGDIVPLLFAWVSGVPYAFLGTAKSEYYLRDEAGLLPRKSWLDDRLGRWFGSVYSPVERWLFRHPRCKAVFCRDQLTADTLRQFAIPAVYLGNPMMDGLGRRESGGAGEWESGSRGVEERENQVEALTIVLLPGSRIPEAYANWQVISLAMMGIIQQFSNRPLRFLGAIAPGVQLESLTAELMAQGWQLATPELLQEDVTRTRVTLRYKNAVVDLSQQAFGDYLHQADLAIAMAGTATEQFVGLGKPAIILPGKGPQFTPAFAEAQTRLLGVSVILVNQPDRVAATLQTLLSDPDRLHLIAENGLRRMGQPGAAAKIATYLNQQVFG